MMTMDMSREQQYKLLAAEGRWLLVDGEYAARVKPHANRVGFIRNVDLEIELMPGRTIGEINDAIDTGRCTLKDGRASSPLPGEYQYRLRDSGTIRLPGVEGQT